MEDIAGEVAKKLEVQFLLILKFISKKKELVKLFDHIFINAFGT